MSHHPRYSYHLLEHSIIGRYSLLQWSSAGPLKFHLVATSFLCILVLGFGLYPVLGPPLQHVAWQSSSVAYKEEYFPTFAFSVLWVQKWAEGFLHVGDAPHLMLSVYTYFNIELWKTSSSITTLWGRGDCFVMMTSLLKSFIWYV